MSKKVLMLTAVVLVFSACQAQAVVNWDGEAVGDNLWDTPENWDPNGVPGSGDDVVISGGTGEDDEEIQLRTNIDILSLNTYGNITLGAWGISWIGITIPNGLTNHGSGSLEIVTDGWIRLYADVTNTTGARLELETVEVEGIFTNEIGATVEMYDEAGFDSDIDNYGTIVVEPFSEMWVEGTLYNDGLIQLHGGEAVSEDTLDNDGTIKGFGAIDSEMLLINSSEIMAEGGVLKLNLEGTFETTGVLSNQFVSSLQIGAVADVNNVGTMYVRSGGGIAINNDLINSSGGVIGLMGGTLAASSITQSSGATFSGAGTIASQDLTIESGAEIELTGPTNIYGDVEIGTDATLEISDGTTLVTGHTTNNGTIYMKGGRIIPQGGFTNNGNVIWEPGLYNNIADFNLDGQVNLQDFADFADTWLWQAGL